MSNAESRRTGKKDYLGRKKSMKGNWRQILGKILISSYIHPGLEEDGKRNAR